MQICIYSVTLNIDKDHWEKLTLPMLPSSLPCSDWRGLLICITMRQICSSVALLHLVPLAVVYIDLQYTYVVYRIKSVLHLITTQIPVVCACCTFSMHCVLMREEKMDFTHFVGHAAC